MYLLEILMKKRIHIIWLIVVGCWLTTQNVSGAAITMVDLPYLCDFEDAAENANWTLNPSVNTITTDNRWVIGSAVAYTGERSLYVSKDGGETSTYASTNNVLLAYRDITLEAGDYDVAYDWLGLGNKTKGYLKVVYANRPTSSLNCLGNSVEPTWVANAVQLMGSNTSLVDGDSWRHVQARVTIPVAQANKTTTRLLFVWVNTDVTVKDSITSVAIDNFQLAKASATDYPDNIHVSTNLGISTITWDGTADNYEVMYRKKTDSEFISVAADGNSVMLQNVEYGAYEFWICVVNGEDRSVYTVFPTVYIYETDCFDALNMYNAQFEYGTWGRTGKTVKGYDRVDYGPSDVRSRHTTHFDLNEVDPRTVIKQGSDTIACLRTVPSGEFGSVRLGNWNTGSEYESMTFHYTVESSSMAVLLVHYAMVLENPDHTAVDQPRFTLDVLNEQGMPIDTKCASVDFHAPTSQEWEDPDVRAIWHELYYVDPKGSNHLVNWQEWKTIGVSMEDYVGQTLTITLTSYDCDQGGHFGYAYFMLNCSRSDVDGLPWGDGSTTQMFTAPEGFDYAWFDRSDVAFADTIDNTDPSRSPYITDGGRFFYVMESDTSTYICHVTYPTNPECGYWFDASAKPHHPKAEMDIRWTPEDCRNGYTWWNRCHVMLINQQNGEVEHRYDKQMENCYLIVDGIDEPVRYVDEGTFVPMPAEGGTVRYCIWTGIYVHGQLHADTAWYEVEIPAIEPLQTHLYQEICRGDAVYFPEGSHDKYMDAGDYYDYLQSAVTGCDSTVILHLTVHEPKLVDVYDTICEGHTYAFNGQQLTTSGKRIAILQSEVTGCDSVVTLYLAVAPRPQFTLLTERICADEPLRIRTNAADYVNDLSLEVDRADSVHAVQWQGDEAHFYFDNVLAGARRAVVYCHMPWCDEVYENQITFTVNLPASIIEARFDDVLAFLSPEYNGGYTFTSYQWYANGVAIEAATGSWYYNTAMDKDAEITVSATMQDGTTVWVCPFTFNTASRPDALDDVRATGKAVKLLRDGQLVVLYDGREFDVLGRRIQ